MGQKRKHIHTLLQCIETSSLLTQRASSSFGGFTKKIKPKKKLEKKNMTAPQAVSQATTSPLKRFAVASTSTCAAEASTYGKCILASYTDMKKDACKAEFEHFGRCLRKAVSILSFLEFVCSYSYES